MNDQERHAAGMTVRRAVLGDAHVDRSAARLADPMQGEFQDLITRYAWGEIWSRPGLPRHTRSLLTIAMMVALNREAELRLHLRAAANCGVSRDEIKEVLLQTAIYCGVPAANSAFHTAEEVLPRDGPVMMPAFEFVLELDVKLSRAIEVGQTTAGFRRIIDIESGTFEGPDLRGTLLPGGADWQIIRTDKVTELHAHYVLRTDDDVLIEVTVRGLRHAPGDALERIAGGEKVESRDYYFRTATVFEAPAGRYDWLNRSVFVGTGERHDFGATIRIFRVA